MAKKTLLQVRHNYPGLMITSNLYLDAFDNQRYRKVVVFLTGKADQQIAAKVPADQVIFLDLKKRHLKGLRLSAVRKLLQVCRENEVRVVLAHRYKPTYIMSLVSLFYRPQSMFSVMHNLEQFRTFSRPIVGRLLFRKRFKFIGVSEAVRHGIISSGIGVSPDHVLALPNCIDVEDTANRLLSRQVARKLLALDPDEFIIGNVGRLNPNKDQITLLRAFADATPQMPRSKLVIIGAGPLALDLQQEAQRLKIGRKVIFAGRIPEAYRIMPAFDVFALTSVKEGLPRVLLEAIVCSLPVIVTDAGGIREVVGDIIDVYPPGDVPLISKALVEHYEMTEQDRAGIGEKLFRHLQTSFSQTAFRKRLLEFVAPNL